MHSCTALLLLHIKYFSKRSSFTPFIRLQVPNPDKVLAAAAILGVREANGSRGSNGLGNGNVETANGGDGLMPPAESRSLATANALLAEVRAQAGRVQMRTLLLTLIEIASAMSYLHRMGESWVLPI